MCPVVLEKVWLSFFSGVRIRFKKRIKCEWFDLIASKLWRIAANSLSRCNWFSCKCFSRCKWSLQVVKSCKWYSCKVISCTNDWQTYPIPSEENFKKFCWNWKSTVKFKSVLREFIRKIEKKNIFKNLISKLSPDYKKASGGLGFFLWRSVKFF